MKNILFLVLALTLIGCGGGQSINVYDGTWSMCAMEQGNGAFINTPFPTGGLPVGGGDGKEFKIQCTPIPKRP